MPAGREIADDLERVLATDLPLLRAIPDAETTRPNRPSGKGWSRREELGHLVDSAVNNHNRFVRAALGPSYSGPGYEQDSWVAVHRYNEIPWPTLVEVWHGHNALLVPLLRGLPEEKLATPCRVGDSEASTLAGLADEYVLHMRHHLDRILGRTPVTKYPR